MTDGAPAAGGRRRWATRRSLVELCSLVGLWAVGCTVPRHVHDPLEFPETKIDAIALIVTVPDAVARPPEGSTARSLPADFSEAVRPRLESLVTGRGPLLEAVVTSAAVDELELVDARGEVTRVAVTLELEVRVHEGPVLRRAETRSVSDIPRQEATHEEVDFVLSATAVNAFERYWASPKTPTALNQDIAAYVKKHPLP